MKASAPSFMRNILVVMLVIVIVLLHALLRNGEDTAVPPHVVPRDTVWVRHDSIVYRTVVLKKTIHDTIPAGLNTGGLNSGYDSLLREHLARRIYADTLLVPAIRGMFIVTDTVGGNLLGRRTWQTSYAVPDIPATVPDTRNEFYVGTGVSMNRKSQPGLQLVLLHRDRRDHITGTFVTVDAAGRLSWGVQAYWKITLKK